MAQVVREAVPILVEQRVYLSRVPPLETQAVSLLGKVQVAAAVQER
jgi:hypothetical protein